jgi:hypothetical protein
MRIQKFSVIQKLIAAAAMVLLASTGTTSANTSIDFTYSLSYSPTSGTSGDVTLTKDLASPYSASIGTTQTTPTNFFTASPASSCTGCTNNTASGTITVTFNFTQPTGISQFTETATYKAQYSGGTLSCSGDSGQTDCVDWTGATNGTSTGVLTVAVTSGLDMYLGNASDWAISPTISFQDVPVPGPAAGSGFPGLFFAIGMIGLVGWRRVAKLKWSGFCGCTND